MWDEPPYRKYPQQAAKLLLIDVSGSYLLLRRNAHPAFGDDPDLPGGTLEAGETLLQGVAREVREEVGVEVALPKYEMLYRGFAYSYHDIEYVLFRAQLDDRPEIMLSWEHISYSWVERGEFLRHVQSAHDTYMHMVFGVLSETKRVR